MIGNYSAATNFGVLISFFTLPIATTLFPLFSKLKYNMGDSLKTVYQLSVKYVSIITMPIVAGMIALSDQIIGLVYPSNYHPASSFLVLYSLNFTIIAFGGLGISNLLNSQGRTEVVFRSSLLNLLTGVPLGLLLIPRFGITGLLLSQLLTKAGFIYLLHWTWKNFGFTFHWESSLKIIFSAGISTALVLCLLRFLNTRIWIEFLVGGILLVLIYVVGIVVLRVVDKEDVRNLNRITTGLGPLTRVFKFLFLILESLINLRR
jgi:O-antigen/teichoic acid export membrane protein